MAKFKCNQEVIMDLVNPTVCSSIEIVPLSRDDYEILERSSNSVEEVFLQQIRIVGLGMSFPLWITPSVCATFRVEHISPSSNQATLVIPSAVLNILTPTEGRCSPTSNEHPTAKKIKISDLFPRIRGAVSDFSTPLPLCAEAFRVVPNSLVKESILLTSPCHPCVIYILGDESLHYSLYSVTLVESALNPSTVQFALSISVPPRSVSDDVFSESIVSVLKMKPNLCVVPNNDYLAYSTILLTTVSERQIVFVKNVDVFPSAEDLECFLSSERRRDIEQSLRDMVVVHPLLLSAEGLSLSVNLGTRSVMVHLVPVDDMTPKERHRQELCCFTAEAACTFTLKFEPFAKKSTISLSEPDNYGFLSQNYSLNLGSHSILINELSEWAEYCWSHTGFGHALLLGSEGSGKTAIATCVARKLAFDHCALSVRVNCSLWKGSHSETVEKKISTEIKKLSARKPSLLILDNFDLLNVAYEEEQRNLEAEKVFQMLWRLLSASIVPVLIVAKQMNSLLKSTITPVGKRLFAVRKTIPSLDQVLKSKNAHMHITNNIFDYLILSTYVKQLLGTEFHPSKDVSDSLPSQ
uniref:Peroxin-1 n=1 Tax=Angiostrongylus cantonensis TaxID=6313 RepID=A0A0K0DR94_ANGCA